MNIRLESLIDRLHFRQHRSHPLLQSFQPKVRVFMERGGYIIKTVESSWELHAALRLRHRVFYGEMLHKRLGNGMDLDDFDLSCDHLVVIDKKRQAIVGTYRLIASTFSHRFYSEDNFFVLDDLLRRPGVKLEIGRACVHKAYRKGLLVALLWKGIHRYLQLTDARYIFGCSTIRTRDPYEVARICRYFSERGYLAQDFDIFPREACRLKGLWEALARFTRPSDDSSQNLIPPLLLFYLRGGARVCAQPAFDRAFRWIVFLTILDTAHLHPSDFHAEL